MLLPSWGCTTRNLVLSLAVATSILLVGCETGRTLTSTPTPTSESEKRTPTAAVSPTASPTDAQTPTASLSPTAAPSIAAERNPEPTLAAPSFDPLPIPPERDLYELARSLFKIDGETPRVVNPEPVNLEQGRTDSFWLTDAISQKVFSIGATLRLVSDHAYWYVENGLDVSDDALERAAREFDESTYPKVTSAFGTEWVPGVDNDPRMTILTANIPGLGGYYSSMDEYPTFVHQFSNQREMVYISGSIPVGSRGHSGVLAHELHHAVLWNADPSEETWVSRGIGGVRRSRSGLPYGTSTGSAGQSHRLAGQLAGVWRSNGILRRRVPVLPVLCFPLFPRRPAALDDAAPGRNRRHKRLSGTEPRVYGDLRRDIRRLDCCQLPGPGRWQVRLPAWTNSIRSRPRRINDYEAFESSMPQYGSRVF